MKNASRDRNAAIAEGLAQGRKLGTLLRTGTSAKRIRMLEELQESASFHEAETLSRSLATCADASLGDDVAHSESIREAAGGFRDVIVAYPPENKRGWKEINEALATPPDEAPPTVRTPAVAHALPTPVSDDHDYGDDENVRYRYLEEKDGS